MMSTDSGKDLHERVRRYAGTDGQGLVALLTSRYRTARITCFAFFTGDPSLSKDPIEVSNHYFILMETRELYPESGIQEYVNHHFTAGKVFVLAHHHARVREMLETGHRFYCGVRKHGVKLFADEPEPGPENFPVQENWIKPAGQHFRNHYGMAESFWLGAAAQLETGQMRIALFLLHQAVEQASIALIRVFLGYRANFHNLGRLLELCSCFTADAPNLFPRNTAEERRLFRILCRSYTETRYVEEFCVNAEDCRDILNAVGAFVKQTEEICLTRLPAFRESLLARNQ